MKTKKEMEKICDEFSQEYGELMLLRANIAAINKMLMKRGKEQELYDCIMECIHLFEREIQNGK